MKIRDRIKELRRVKASELRPNPHNWRMHTSLQRDALCGVLAEIGYAGALLARELPDGSLELIDGHLRAETTPDADVPVLVLDLDQDEAQKLLAVHDPLAAMAEVDKDALSELLASVEIENDALAAMLANMSNGQSTGETPAPPSEEIDVPEAYQVVVECSDEDQQRAVYERMTAEGFDCRLLTL